MHDEMSVKDLKKNTDIDWKTFVDGESYKSGLYGDPFLYCLAISSRTPSKNGIFSIEKDINVMTTEFLTLPATFEVAMNGIVIRTILMDQ